MYEVKIPYSDWELNLALIGAMLIVEKRQKDFEYLMDDLDKKVGDGLLQGMSEYYKIDKIILIQSPNYNQLKIDFQEFLVNALIKSFIGLGLTKVQAYSLIAYSQGLLGKV